jgi:hypothetical protein
VSLELFLESIRSEHTRECYDICLRKYGYQKLSITEEHDKVITSLRTAYAEELNLKKDITSYDDLLDALRPSLRGHKLS